jgi:Fe-S cluster assembly iron-binding protein IscA
VIAGEDVITEMRPVLHCYIKTRNPRERRTSQRFCHAKETAMLTVTDTACVYLREMLDRSQAPDNAAVRIVAKGNELKTTIDSARDGDSIVEHQGRQVLVLDEGLSARLSERTLDVEPEARSLLLT